MEEFNADNMKIDDDIAAVIPLQLCVSKRHSREAQAQRGQRNVNFA